MADEFRARVTTDEATITMESRWIRRKYRVAEGIATKEYHIRPTGEGAWLAMFSFLDAAPMEAEFVIDGAFLRVAPWKHYNLLHEGHFAYIGHDVERTDRGVRLAIRMRPRTGPPDVEVDIHTEIFDAAPALKRWVTVRNTGAKPVMIERAVVEVVPAVRLGREATVYDSYVAPKAEDSPDFIGWQMHGFDRGPDVTLAPGETFESFAAYTVVSSGYVDDRAAAMNALLRAEAPWTTNPPLRHLFGRPAPWQEILALGERSHDLGFEAFDSFVGVHFTNTGDFILNPAVFPNGEQDLRKLVDGLHAIGMKIILYVGFCIAIHEAKVRLEHPDWEMTGPEGRPYDPGGVGNMCPTSGWGAFLLEKFRWLVDEIGVDGLETDGPYYGQPCHRTTHAHRSPGEAQYRNWRFEMDFYREMRAKGKIVHTPSSLYALLHGATSLPQGYREEDARELALFDLVTAFRTSLYTGQMRGLPGWAAWGFAAIDPYHGHGIWPPEEHLAEYEHLIAGHFGIGLSAFIFGWDIANGPESERILRRWIGFYRTYRATLQGDAVFVRPPDGLHPDGMLHVRPGAEVPAVLVAFNPSKSPVAVDWSIPLGRAGLAGEVSVRRDGHDPEARRLDDVGNLALRIALAPYEVAWYEFRRAAGLSRTDTE